MDAGILQALNSVKNNRYVKYVGLGLAGLVTQKGQLDEETGKPTRKTKLQLIRISAAVCGIELCYAAETAFVSPILLKLGVPASLMTMVWCLSPVLGFFLVPVMGSLSDRCRMSIGRRRPFIIVMSIGIIIGLALVPNGAVLGSFFGDSKVETLGLEDSVSTPGPSVNMSDSFLTVENKQISHSKHSSNRDNFRGIIFTIIGVAMLDFNCDACQSPCRAYLLDVSVPEDHSTGLTMFTVMAGAGGTIGYLMGGIDWNATSFGEAFGGHIRVVFTLVILAFVFCVISTLTSFKETPLSDLSVSDEQLQSSKTKKGKKKYKKFVNDDSSDEDEREGIERDRNTISYGAIYDNMKKNQQDDLERGLHSSENGISKPVKEGVNLAISGTTNDFSENTAHELKTFGKGNVANDRKESGCSQSRSNKEQSNCQIIEQNESFAETTECVDNEISPYSKRTTSDDGTGTVESIETLAVSTDVTLKTYLTSILHMPKCLWILCICNLFCWMSLVCYSLYFTDFVGSY